MNNNKNMFIVNAWTILIEWITMTNLDANNRYNSTIFFGRRSDFVRMFIIRTNLATVVAVITITVCIIIYSDLSSLLQEIH
jgi:hypothetical protein